MTPDLGKHGDRRHTRCPPTQWQGLTKVRLLSSLSPAHLGTVCMYARMCTYNTLTHACTDVTVHSYTCTTHRLVHNLLVTLMRARQHAHTHAHNTCLYTYERR